MRGKEEGTIDSELVVKKAANGDQEAFRLLVEEYKQLVFSICLNIVQDSFEAENLAQETFLQVYRSLPQYQFKGFKTWLSRIAINKAIDYKRRARSRLEREIRSFENIEEIIDDGMSVQEMIDRREEIRILKACMQKIPEPYMRVLKKATRKEKAVRKLPLKKISVQEQ